jgi:hypothetical protein
MGASHLRLHVVNMEDKILAAKLFFGAAGLALSLVASKWALIGASSREFRITATTLLVASRLLLFISLFIILGFSAQSDVTVYYTQAKAVRAGLVPYRDFPLSYAPLFPYINAAAVAVWDSPKSIVLLAVLFELAAFPLWLSISNMLFSEREARLATLLYVTSPVPIVNVCVAGQNQVWVMLALGPKSGNVKSANAGRRSRRSAQQISAFPLSEFPRGSSDGSDFSCPCPCARRCRLARSRRVSVSASSSQSSFSRKVV